MVTYPLIFFENMPQTLVNLLGTNATKTGTTVSFDLEQLKDAAGVKFLANATTATAAQIGAAIVAALHQNTKPAKDANGADVVDATNAIVSATSFAPKTFEVRGTTSQIRNEFTFYVYTTDSTAFDPDNAV
jgi:hypothetical protein